MCKKLRGVIDSVESSSALLLTPRSQTVFFFFQRPDHQRSREAVPEPGAHG